MAKRTTPKNRYLVRMAKDGWFEDSSKNTYYPTLQKARSAIYSKLVKMHNEDYCGYIICNDKIINRVVWKNGYGVSVRSPQFDTPTESRKLNKDGSLNYTASRKIKKYLQSIKEKRL